MSGKTKRMLLSAVLLITLVLSGCQAQTHEEEDYLYFLFATPLRNHVIWLQAKAGFEQACEDLRIRHDWIGPDVIDTEAMEDVMWTGLLQDADAIVTQGVVSDELVNFAWELGIPVFLVDSDMPDSRRICYMGKDFKEQAELLLAHIEERVAPDTELRIAIQVAESSFAIAQEQIKQVEDVFARHPGGYEIVSVTTGEIEPPEPIEKVGDYEGVIREGKAGIRSEAYLETYRYGKLVRREKLRTDSYAPIRGIVGVKREP